MVFGQGWKKTEENYEKRHYKYDPNYCELLIKHMRDGLTFDSFAGIVSVTRATLYEWVKHFPEFSEAKKIGASKSLLFWDKLGVAGTAGKLKGFNANSYKFNMMNRHRWAEKQSVAVSGDDKAGPVKVQVYLPDNGRGDSSAAVATIDVVNKPLGLLEADNNEDDDDD